MKRITIIGGGFSGAIIAARLMRQTLIPVTVFLVDASGRIGPGMAYGTKSSEHVLNVPAGNMSAFHEEPDHFLNYARRMDPRIDTGSFVSRHLYGDYLEWLLNEAEETASESELKRIAGRVTNIFPVAGDTAAVITLENGETLEADKVVLALGHSPAIWLPVADMTFYLSHRYLHDPWDHSRMMGIPAEAPVILFGTGLTAVDVAMTLLKENPKRRITAISRRGLLPQAHRHVASRPLERSAESIWGTAKTVREQLRAFRLYCRLLVAQGRDWREGIALLRPETADIWLAFSDKERERFLRHVQPFWDTHRHRLAPAAAERLREALSAGTFRTLAGRVLALKDDGEGAVVSLRLRGSQGTHQETGQYVINCTGPSADPRQDPSALVQQLLRNGLIRTDRLGLGIEVTKNCAVVTANGRASPSLFYIGPWLKAMYWEATAVPDLRVIAKNLANHLVRED